MNFDFLNLRTILINLYHGAKTQALKQIQLDFQIRSVSAVFVYKWWCSRHWNQNGNEYLSLSLRPFATSALVMLASASLFFNCLANSPTISLYISMILRPTAKLCMRKTTPNGWFSSSCSYFQCSFTRLCDLAFQRWFLA